MPDRFKHCNHVLHLKGDGRLGTKNVVRVDREGSLECVGTLKN